MMPRLIKTSRIADAVAGAMIAAKWNDQALATNVSGFTILTEKIPQYLPSGLRLMNASPAFIFVVMMRILVNSVAGCSQSRRV